MDMSLSMSSINIKNILQSEWENDKVKLWCSVDTPSYLEVNLLKALPFLMKYLCWHRWRVKALLKGRWKQTHSLQCSFHFSCYQPSLYIVDGHNAHSLILLCRDKKKSTTKAFVVNKILLKTIHAYRWRLLKLPVLPWQGPNPSVTGPCLDLEECVNVVNVRPNRNATKHHVWK